MTTEGNTNLPLLFSLLFEVPTGFHFYPLCFCTLLASPKLPASALAADKVRLLVFFADGLFRKKNLTTVFVESGFRGPLVLRMLT